MSHHHMEYATLMRKQGFRITPQREIILDAVCIGNGHSTFDKIAERVAAVAPAISTATIYRTLEFFEHLGVVVTGNIRGERIYEAAQGTPHHHLLCTQCSRCLPLDDTLVEPLRREILAQLGFAADMDHLIVEGICAECQKTKA